MVAGAPLRIAFFGTPAFALPTLDALTRSAHRIVGVVTQPDRPRGRGQRTVDAPVKARASTLGLPILQPERLTDASFVDAFTALRPDLGVVVAYGRILTDAVLAAPPLGLINVHASLLPRYRGAAPVQRAIIAGERETGVTIMRVVKALDAGPMLAIARRLIGADETSEEVERDLAAIGASLLVATVDNLVTGSVDEIPQNSALATYAPRLSKEDGRIDWTMPADRVHNLIRGLHPWPHAFSFLGDDRLIFLRARPSDRSAEALGGTVLEALGDRLRIAAGTGSVDVIELQSEGKRPMSVRQFLAGRPLRPGDRFQSRP